ncbi:rhodanese-like domain-containing protein [Flavihumibacter fluvii]|jgi:phage shock protein E|uniref:rhodanese-like domain-containing protein n=1 Tax=Flavihumibacter fluvii TaxID=2838157 RepID=UPI001BDDDE6B|nr:rhodanese-like domain-containing protein [Flavihumibacter fluvii]ULQ51541.1 rhodanese-like domain-containing protein [Flavihumibacter fluvii]
MSFLQNLFGPKADFKAIKANGAIIVDVRSEGEFASGHIPGSINIPLDQINSKLNDLKKKNVPVITVCRSGARSGMAKSQLSAAGLEAYNGGPWDSLINQLN